MKKIFQNFKGNLQQLVGVNPKTDVISYQPNIIDNNFLIQNIKNSNLSNINYRLNSFYGYDAPIPQS